MNEGIDKLNRVKLSKTEVVVYNNKDLIYKN